MKNSIKKVLVSMIAAFMLVAPMVPVAQAGTIGPTNFNVTVTLTTACSATAPADVVFAYTSFQVANQASTGGGFSVTCTNTLPYSMSLSAASGTIIGLNYQLALPGQALGAAGPLPIGSGSGAVQALAITGQMASGQSGTCALATCTPAPNVHTLTITY